MIHIPVAGATGNYEIVHLVPMLKPMYPPNLKLSVLPVSINCLYDDLLAAIDIYAAMLRKDQVLEHKFQQAMNALLEPEMTHLTW